MPDDIDELLDERRLLRAVGALPRGRRVRLSGRSRGSALLHRLNQASASTAATALAVVVSLGFLAAALLAGSATRWLTAFEALAAAVTLVMVFALQHTQARHQVAVQRKLDEVLRALPGADMRLVHVESASQHELDALEERHDGVRRDALDEEPAAG